MVSRNARPTARQRLRTLRAVLPALVLGAASAASAKEAPASPVLGAMKQELGRSMKALRAQPLPPYFLGYEITETHEVTVRGSHGTITESEDRRARVLDVDLRVGSYELDNTHQLRGTFDFVPRQRVSVPMGEDADAIRSILWYHTDQKYRQATERLTRVETDVQVKVEEEDRSADFSRETAEKFREPIVDVQLDRARWEERIRAYTAPFASHPHILQADAFITGEARTRWFVSSEGAEIQTSQTACRLMITALTKAEDGMELPRYESFYASSPANLPGDEEMLAVVHRMIADLDALRRAPVVDPYTGPAILSGRASGVFFHEVFGHRIEGHRQKDEEEGQTFKKKIGEKVLPETFSVYFDPTLSSHRGTELAGFYRFDNQGVKARRVAVVRHGVFESFLMSRSPIAGFTSSNGHGRRQPGFMPVARQSNLLLEVERPDTPEGLKRRLLDLIREEGKPFGLRFEDIQGGFTITGRTIPNAFNVLPILVHRVYADGREELVRGVDLIGTPLTAFSKMVAADDSFDVFNGICGAESGWVPVAAASPGILLSQIEVQKKEKSQERPPILPAPTAAPDPKGARNP